MKQSENLVLTPPDPIVPASPSAMDLARLFIERGGSDAGQLRELLQLHRELKADAAKEAFIAAMKQFKTNPPEIHKTKDGPRLGGSNQPPAYKYAPLDEVCDAIIPALAKVGITHRWEPSYEGEWTVMACVLTHEMGHSERTIMRGCRDTGPGRNAIQSDASTTTYLQRYTLLAACGLATRGSDNDGAGGGLDEGHVQERCEWIMNAADSAELEKLYKQAANEALDAADKKAIECYKKAKAERKAQL